MPQWLKVVLIVIAWDIIRIFIQAFVNKRVLKKDFDDLEETIEEEKSEPD